MTDGKAVEVWPGHPDFPSGHMTFVAALGTTVLLVNLSWRRWMVGAWVLAGASLVAA